MQLIKAIEQRRQDLLLLMERHPALSSSHQDGEERVSNPDRLAVARHDR